jgi:1,4-dihydroxy-2-naphthoyl-CoA hydrolase
MKVVDLVHLNDREQKTLLASLGIKIIFQSESEIHGTMPVDARTHQPMGLLHGGASVALAETLGSIGANLSVDNSQYYCVGLEINANHISGVRQGEVTGVAKPLHLGKSTQVWEIKIHDTQTKKLVCVSRLTMAVIKKAP